MRETKYKFAIDFAIYRNAFEEVDHFFKKRDKSLEGNGYDWEDVIRTYVKEHWAKEKSKIKYDSEAGALYVYSKNKDIMEKLAGELAELIKTGGIEEYIMRTKFSDL